MRINEKGQCAGTTDQNMDGLHFQNMLEREPYAETMQFMDESGMDHTGIRFFKKGLERG